MTRVAVKTIGCKTNYADTSALISHLESLGYDIVPFGENAEVVIVNSCVVTQRAETDSRRAINKGKRINPGARTILTGCGAMIEDARLFADYPDIILPIQQLLLGEEVGELTGNETVQSPEGASKKKIAPVDVRTRRFVKIQNGCNYRCAYCIVPLVRGKSASRHHDSVLEEIILCEEAGHPEAVLTGIHIGHYGRDNSGGISLSDLVELIIKKTRKIRIRLSSLEIDEIPHTLVEMLKSENRLCSHLHIPLQSGDNYILKKMRRWYTTGEYRAFLNKIKFVSEKICIGTDVITGFPGETDESFEKTLTYFNSLPVDYAHVFTFSKREGTEAATMSGQVPEGKKRGRTAKLREAAEEKRRDFIDRFIGKSLEVVCEKLSPTYDMFHGTSDNYIKVRWKGDGVIYPGPVKVEIEGRDGDEAIGTHRG